MTVEVRFFASLREIVGRDGISLTLAEGELPSAALLEQLRGQLDAEAITALGAESVRLALNHELQNGPFVVRDGDEVAFLPPVTGG